MHILEIVTTAIIRAVLLNIVDIDLIRLSDDYLVKYSNDTIEATNGSVKKIILVYRGYVPESYLIRQPLNGSTESELLLWNGSNLL